MSEQRPGEPYRRDGLMDYLDTVSRFAITNLLWVVCSLLVVTMPAATAGMFAVLTPWVQGQTVEPLSHFFGGIRRYGLKGTALGILNLLFAALTALNLLLLPQMGMGQMLTILVLSVTLLMATLVLMVNMYAWPLLVILDLPLLSLLQKSFTLALVHPGWSLLIVIAALLPLLVSLFLPQVFLLVVTFALSALIISWGAWRVIQRYVETDESEAAEDSSLHTLS